MRQLKLNDQRERERIRQPKITEQSKRLKEGRRVASTANERALFRPT